MREPVTAYLGIGANLGNARAAVAMAVQRLGLVTGIEVTARSSLYRTAPLASSGPDYTNAVVEVRTVLTAPALLACLHAVEADAGRNRPFRNAPRTLDLDILIFGDGRIASAALTIPHPRMWLRAFVLVPLAEIAPHRVSLAQLQGTAGQTQDLLSGQIQMMFDQPSNAVQHVRSGRIKAHAVLAKDRLAMAPEIPTVDEAGLPGLYVSTWYGLWAPKGTPKDIVARLNAAAVEALADPAVAQKLTGMGFAITPRERQTPAALATHHKAEIEKWSAIIKASGVKAE